MVLDLDGMELRHPGLTAEVAAANSQAARVCLDRHHSPPIGFTVENSGDLVKLRAEWRPTSAAEKAAWANDTDTTEQGAYACALASIEAVRELVAIRRAETGTGSDYYLAPSGADPQDLEAAVRLEVSGVDSGGRGALAARAVQKRAQALAGASNLPAVVAIVGFKEGRVVLQDV